MPLTLQEGEKNKKYIHCIITNGLHVFIRGIHSMVYNCSHKLHQRLQTTRIPIVLNHTRDVAP